MTYKDSPLKRFIEAEEVLGENRVIRVLEVAWDEENNDDFLWSINGCRECERDLHEGERGFVWGRPANNDLDCKTVVLETYCSKDCIEEATGRWLDEIQQDAYIVYFEIP